jgi:hypothetical protein
MVCLALVLTVFTAKCCFDAATERLRREHERMTARPASPYSAHWYLGADNQSHLLPGHRNPYVEYDDDDDLVGGVVAASTLPSVPSTAATRPGGSAGLMRTPSRRSE